MRLTETVAFHQTEEVRRLETFCFENFTSYEANCFDNSRAIGTYKLEFCGWCGVRVNDEAPEGTKMTPS